MVALLNKIPDVTSTATKLAAAVSRFDKTITTASLAAGIKSAIKAGDGAYTAINLRQSEYDQVHVALAAIPGLAIQSSVRDLPPVKDLAKVVLTQAVPVAQKLTAGTPGWRIATIDVGGRRTVHPGPEGAGAGTEGDVDARHPDAGGRREGAGRHPGGGGAGRDPAVHRRDPDGGAERRGQRTGTDRADRAVPARVDLQDRHRDRGGGQPPDQRDHPGELPRRVDRSTARRSTTRVSTSAPSPRPPRSRTPATPRSPSWPRRCQTTALPATAKEYGIGLDFDIPGIITLTGKVPAADSLLSRAQNGFGQGDVLVTPFSEVLMAATVAAGAMPTPTLIRGTKTTVDQPAPARSAAAKSDPPDLHARRGDRRDRQAAAG